LDRVERIENILKTLLIPGQLEVTNFSHEHNVAKGADSHIRVFAVSESFEGLRMVKRHRLIYSALESELSNGLHALQLDIHSVNEWAEQQTKITPPKCKGG
jgi:stress-induced morphogen